MTNGNTRFQSDSHNITHAVELLDLVHCKKKKKRLKNQENLFSAFYHFFCKIMF